MYAFSENYCLPLSHDEVVHGKGSLLQKMPGDEWQRFANLRLLYGYQWAQPGKKLLFMGGELAQPGEWAHGGTVDWPMVDQPGHQGMLRWLQRLNALYRDEPALHDLDTDPAGFEWVVGDDHANSVVAFLRLPGGDDPARPVLFVGNFTPVTRENYRIGVPDTTPLTVLANSDDPEFGGSGSGPMSEQLTPTATPHHGLSASVAIELPPLAVLLLAPASSASPT
ncbi:MAG: alpha amylase C-terminal domain-containing protein [Acidimicrobiia bacterium]|nr:alpha amylase C-terminal domain-containing protein [Acidimicrobiia bacterium]